MQSSLKARLLLARPHVTQGIRLRPTSIRGLQPLAPSKRHFYQTAIRAKDEETKTATWPTAESVILQRISSTGIHPSLSHLKTGKEVVVVNDNKADSKPETEALSASSTNDGPSGSVQSVSGIINSVRENRAASQKKQRPHQDVDSEARQRSAEVADSQSGSKDARSIEEEKEEEGDDEEPLPYFWFNTYDLVDRLSSSGYTREQATSIMTLVKHKMHHSMERIGDSMLTKSDLENDAYLFRAALQELRTETQMIRKNDQSLLESQAAAISRDIDSLAQKINDEVANLRSDIEIELNNHKHDTNHEMKSLDMELHELASKYQVVMGEMKTDIEAVKLESIRRGLVTAVLTTLFLTALIWTPDLLKRLRDGGAGKNKDAGVQDEVNGHGGSSDSTASLGATGSIIDAMLAQNGRRGLVRGESGIPIGPAGTSQAAKLHPLAYPSPDGAIMLSKDGEDDNGYASSNGQRYRDHSHLNIQYDPPNEPDSYMAGARPARGFSRNISGSDSQDDYDDWFDSFFYSPSRNGDKEPPPEHAGSASLMDSDPKVDSTFLDAPEKSSNDKKSAEPAVHIPLTFTYGGNSNSESSTESKS
ncbi:hypothetical protein GGI15_004528 [Coemansia interrupta]|uniref:Uncharacterized protein n=1 Tax=Coemansia interrupta TaxID=1126814 RepID=A0A9W8H2Q9_9FUNG|nr:hypothetical protein GGI15_004528 [Coemansia interrupta]